MYLEIHSIKGKLSDVIIINAVINSFKRLA